MKQSIFLTKLMVISMFSLINGVLSAANSSRVEKAAFTGSMIPRSNGVKATSIGSIELLSKLETFHLGVKIFGSKKALTELGSGFAQTAPGATEDLNPRLDTKSPPAADCELGFETGNELRNQLIKLIDKPNLSSVKQENLEAWLHVIINQKKEIVVLLVETDSDFVDQYLKSKLNYKKISSSTAGGRYSMKVTLKNS